MLYTPLEETFAFPLASAVAFASTADPWVGAEESRIPALCRERGIPCRSIPGANHSLLTGDEATDTRNLTLVLRETERFLLSRDEEARRRRIERHEALLNEAAQLLSGAELTEKERVVLREDTSALAAYYGSAAWKRDYAADEHGLLPGDLKRGVLSEDGIDTLLEQYREFTADESASKE